MEKYNKKRPTRKPSHPGEILKNLWLDELGYSQSHFAELLVEASGGLSKKSTLQTKLNEVISGKRSMSAEFAVLISKVLKSSPKMWMNLQIQLDIWEAEDRAA
ncbi:MAG TPA: HigA family addiction module antitoxin [Pseudobdellovibrionaceae bacterium]|nr:HigA family addiction module antitoxin [Pseudobdellovibrionaceae bacterium]